MDTDRLILKIGEEEQEGERNHLLPKKSLMSNRNCNSFAYNFRLQFCLQFHPSMHTYIHTYFFSRIKRENNRENLSLGNNITKRKEGSVEETLLGGGKKSQMHAKAFSPRIN